MQVEGRQRATLTSALAGRTIVVDTDRSIAALIDALALEDAVIAAEGRCLLEDDDELFVIKLIDAQGDRLGLRALGSMLPVDTLDETVLLVALLIFVDLSERIALLYGLGDEDIFVEAKARIVTPSLVPSPSLREIPWMVFTSSENSLVNSWI